MSKANQAQVRSEASKFGSDAKNQFQSNTFGGTGGAYGPSGLSGSRGEAQGRQGQTFGSAFKGYEEAQQTGGFDPEALKKVRENTQNITDTGGYDPEQVNKIRGQYDRTSQTGGFDPNQLDYLRTQGKTFADTGGYDPNDLSSLRKGYQNFADTGGFTDEEKNNFLNRATSGVSGTYNVLSNEAQRRRNLTGGLGTGGDISQLAREATQKQADATLNAQDTLASQVRTGKLAGLGGIAGVSSDVAGKREAALSGLGGLETSVAGGQREQIGKQAGFEGDIATGKRAGVGLGIGAESQVASGRLEATKGMHGLFTTSTGEVSDMGNQILQQMGLANASEQYKISILTQLSNTPGLMDNIIKVINVANSIANSGPKSSGTAGGTLPITGQGPSGGAGGAGGDLNV